jgi:hypothetical protein
MNFRKQPVLMKETDTLPGNSVVVVVVVAKYKYLCLGKLR